MARKREYKSKRAKPLKPGEVRVTKVKRKAKAKAKKRGKSIMENIKQRQADALKV